MFCVSKNINHDDLLYFVRKVVLIKEMDNEVNIEIELKEMLIKNETIKIILKYDGNVMKEIKLRRENDDRTRIEND